MSSGLAPPMIAAHFIGACREELAALKPGNVHVHAPGHNMNVNDFELSAAASAPHIATRGLSVGQRIRRAVDASVTAAGCNTNLGIILLCAPLAAAAETDATDFRQALSATLDRLDRNDAEDAFAAIALANPAGLGRTESGDVLASATITLREAMHLAADRDRIARAYVTDYADIFEFGLPCLQSARSQTPSLNEATTALHMSLLAAFPDSHIARKHGLAAAQRVTDAARDKLPGIKLPLTDRTFAELLEFDKWLKSQGLNPGTTADFVVATLFAARIISSGRGSKGR